MVYSDQPAVSTEGSPILRAASSGPSGMMYLKPKMCLSAHAPLEFMSSNHVWYGQHDPGVVIRKFLVVPWESQKTFVPPWLTRATGHSFSACTSYGPACILTLEMNCVRDYILSFPTAQLLPLLNKWCFLSRIDLPKMFSMFFLISTIYDEVIQKPRRENLHSVPWKLREEDELVSTKQSMPHSYVLDCVCTAG